MLVNACAITNITSTKKNTGLMKLANALPAGASPRMGCSTIASSAVIAMGTASVTHRIRAVTKSAPARWASGGIPGGAGSARSSAAAMAAAARDTVALVVGDRGSGDGVC